MEDLKGYLRGLAIFALIIVLLILTSCTPDEDFETCTGGCETFMELPGTLDENGYYHIDLDFSGLYLPWFIIDVYATPATPDNRYNGISVIEAEFDSDTFWNLGDNVIFQVPLYNPFESYLTSSGYTLPATIQEISIDYFQGITLNIVQNTGIYFNETDNPELMHTRRVVGPFPPQIVGDTITIYSEIYWEAGNDSMFKELSAKFIIE